jgi:non-heme chloroperoxidase
MPFIKVDEENGKEVMLYLEDHGHGDPVVLIHGYPFSGNVWEKQLATLIDEGYRVITYDRRGFGMSSKTVTGYDYDTFASDLHIIMSELNLENVTLVGHSMGSGEVIRYISKYGSAKVKCAVLVSPLQPFLLKTDDNSSGLEKKIFEGFKQAIKVDRYSFITEFLKNFYNLGVLGKNAVSDEKLRADFTLASMSSPIAFLKCVDTWPTDFRQDLRNIDVPLLVIHGDKDKILPFDSTAKLIPQYVKAELQVLKGGSHGIPWTHADEISHSIIDFMNLGITVVKRPESGSEAQIH